MNIVSSFRDENQDITYLRVDQQADQCRIDQFSDASHEELYTGDIVGGVRAFLELGEEYLTDEDRIAMLGLVPDPILDHDDDDDDEDFEEIITAAWRPTPSGGMDEIL